MTPSERRTALLRLLARIDQQIEEAAELAADPLLSAEDREFAQAQLDFRRRTIERVERMLAVE